MDLVALILLSVLFFVTHLGMSHDPYRSRMVRKLGDKPFMGVYSLISFITLGGAIWVFSGHRNTGPVLWTLCSWGYPLIYLLMLMAFLLLVLSFITPSPTSMRPPAVMQPYGVLRITRHPMNMGFACFGLAHMLANGCVGDLFFFGSLFAVGFFGAYHQDRRKVREKGAPFVAFQKQTSVLPFAALITGKNRFDLKEFKLPVVVVVVIGYVALILLHQKLFGVRPF